MLDFSFRKKALRGLTNEPGVYVLTDLEKVPVYVGQSVKGIRGRVQRHLTSARSDIIANRQLDVWEIAWVLAFPEANLSRIPLLESTLYHHFHAQSALMNGTVPPKPKEKIPIPKPVQEVQLIRSEDIRDRSNSEIRLPRQANHYADMVDHFLVVKNSVQLARAMEAHFQRLKRYHRSLLEGPLEDDVEETE